MNAMAPFLLAGIHQIDGADYHRDPAPAPSLSSGLARTLLKQSPLHAWCDSPRLNPNWEPEEKKTFDIGRAAHRAILGAGSDFVAIPDSVLASNGAASTKEAKAFIEDARRSGLTPLKAAEVDQIAAMQAKAADRLQANQIVLDPARSELVVIAEIDGTWCRAMIDNAPADPRQPLYDVKTCEDASPEACMRSVMNYGYDVQAAHYVETWRAATGESRAFRFIFQEKSEPHEVCVVELSYETLFMAAKKIARAREMWRLCLRDNRWPGYPPGVNVIDLPDFFHNRWIERESAEADHKQRTGLDVLEAARQWQAPHAAE